MIKVKKWSDIHEQRFRDGDKRYVIKNLISLASELPVQEMPLEHLCISFLKPKIESLFEFVCQVKTTLEADLNCPIILDEEGYVMDGRHRIARAILEGKETIKFVRFNETPKPDYYSETKNKAST